MTFVYHSVAWVPLEGRFSITINQEVGACAVELMKPGWSHFALTWSSANNGSWNLWFGKWPFIESHSSVMLNFYFQRFFREFYFKPPEPLYQWLRLR